MSRSFDPRPHLRQLANGAPHLDVKWRLHWLRTEHADAQIDTSIVSVEGDVVICRANVRLPNGGSATAHGAASRSGGGASTADLIERAESRALGRALATLGYGAQYLEEDAVGVTRPSTAAAAPAQANPARDPYDDGTMTAEQAAPQRQRPAAPAQQPQPQPQAQADSHAYDDPDSSTRQREARQMRETRPERTERPERAERPERYEREAPPAAPPAAAPAAAPMRRGSELRGHDAPRMGDTPAREDVAWQRFWEWARARGYRDADHLREILGVEVLALTPREVRDLIRRFELDHPPGADDEL